MMTMISLEVVLCQTIIIDRIEIVIIIIEAEIISVCLEEVLMMISLMEEEEDFNHPFNLHPWVVDLEVDNLYLHLHLQLLKMEKDKL
mmetsp:Transcript_9649/g.862  ORF Transcript_9649/g.862 Transcript_9649/m.862 type:complete len:87 (+) Transcript_9649:642-902(+)